MRHPLPWAVSGLALLAALVAVVALQGCGAGDGLRLGTTPTDYRNTTGTGASAPFASTIGLLLKLGWLAALIGFAGTVASFFIPIIPRKAAMVSIALGVGSAVLADFFREVGRPLMWGIFGLAVVALLCALWPMVAAYLNLRKAGKELISDGKSREGVAVLSMVSNAVNDNRKEIAKGLTGSPATAMATAEAFSLPVPKPAPGIPSALGEST